MAWLIYYTSTSILFLEIIVIETQPSVIELKWINLDAPRGMAILNVACTRDKGVGNIYI